MSDLTIEEKILDRVCEETGLEIWPKYEYDEQFILDISVPNDVFHDGTQIIVNALMVPLSKQGQGYGTQIMRTLEKVAKEFGIRSIGFHAFPYTYGEPGNTIQEILDLMEFYRWLGYENAYPQELEFLKQEYDPDERLAFSEIDEDALWMEKEVE